MSQYPDPGQYPQPNQPYLVPNYYGGGDVVPNPRPASVTSLAIIGIILGSLAALVTGIGLLFYVFVVANGGKMPAWFPGRHIPEQLLILSIVQTLGNFTLSVIMLACCIGALKLKPRARRVMIPWAIVTLGWASAVTVATLLWLNSDSKKALDREPYVYHQRVYRTTRPTNETAVSIRAIFSGIVACIFPVCVLTFWSTPRVKAAFEGSQPLIQVPYPPA